MFRSHTQSPCPFCIPQSTPQTSPKTRDCLLAHRPGCSRWNEGHCSEIVSEVVHSVNPVSLNPIITIIHSNTTKNSPSSTPQSPHHLHAKQSPIRSHQIPNSSRPPLSPSQHPKPGLSRPQPTTPVPNASPDSMPPTRS